MDTKSYCYLPFDELFVLSTGEVVFGCCQGPPQSLGNVLEQPLETIWNSPLAEDVRRQSTTPELHPFCRHGCFITDRIARGEAALYPAHHPGWPTKVTISLPDNHCNIGGDNPTPDTACIMCNRAAVGFVRPADHTDLIAERVRPLMERLRVLAVTGVAEPLWKDRLFQVLDQLEFARFADRVLVETNSNGTTLSPRVRARWLSTCPRSHLVVSIDAASSETYRKIRRLDAYDTIINHVRGYVRERDPERQAIYLFHNINLLNIREVEAMVETAAELGVDGMSMTLTFEWNDQIRPYLIGDDTAILFARAHAKAVKRAEALGVNLSFGRFLYGDYPQLVQLRAS